MKNIKMRGHETFKSMREDFQDQSERLNLKFNRKIHMEVVKNIITFSRSLMSKPNCPLIDENVFRAVLSQRFGLTAPNMLQRMYVVASKADRPPIQVSVEKFSEMLLVFLGDSVKLKADFAFSVYDTNNNGYISKADLRTLLAPMIAGAAADDDFDDEEDVLRYFVDLVTTRIDIDQDNNIDRWEFQELVKKDILMLQFLGPCLPEKKEVETFKKLVTNKPQFEVQAYFRHERSKALNKPILPSAYQSLYPLPLELP